MQYKNLFYSLLSLCVLALLATAAPVAEKKSLKQLVIKRSEGPTPVARAEEYKPSHVWGKRATDDAYHPKPSHGYGKRATDDAYHPKPSHSWKRATDEAYHPKPSKGWKRADQFVNALSPLSLEG
ncbi:hypothetical protein CPB85DRAFT_1429805 [Mucidula mucida]|nr:hypothetical protein CPB85DRAFT_1429805 [Mucidula mucida]